MRYECPCQAHQITASLDKDPHTKKIYWAQSIHFLNDHHREGSRYFGPAHSVYRWRSNLLSTSVSPESIQINWDDLIGVQLLMKCDHLHGSGRSNAQMLIICLEHVYPMIISMDQVDPMHRCLSSVLNMSIQWSSPLRRQSKCAAAHQLSGSNHCKLRNIKSAK